MVKSDTPETDQTASSGLSNAERLAQKLRQEGNNLLQSRRLVQKSPITPLQIHDIDRIVDPVLLPPDMRVAVLTDRYGQAALACGQIRPHWQVTGFVDDTRTLMNIRTLSTPKNVDFNTLRALEPFKPHAILAVGWAHRTYSALGFQKTLFQQALKSLLITMPENGQLLIQDFATPVTKERFVMMDWSDDEAAEALIEYAVHARADGPPALRGFFLEELPSPRADVRRFRLPYQWAVEWYHRWRLGIAPDAPFELTQFSTEEWSDLLEACGARVTYRTPHEASFEEQENIQKWLQFYDEDGHPLPLPPSTFTLLVEKIEAHKGLSFYERRVAGESPRMLVLSDAPESKERGAQSDAVIKATRGESDVLPWYMDMEGRVRILVRTHVPRPVINRVARGTPNIDGRAWAGYLIEPLSMLHVEGDTGDKPDLEAVASAIAHFTQLPPTAVQAVEAGVPYYPAPNYLMQRVNGVLARIRQTITAEGVEGRRGRVIDVLADDVLDAIACGMIPDGKLEILISKLLLDLGVSPRSFERAARPSSGQAAFKKVPSYKASTKLKDAQTMETYLNEGNKAQNRPVRSVFVEDHAGPEGRVAGRYAEFDYILPGRLTSNIVACVPYIRDPMGQFLLADEPQKMPIPQRMGDDREMVMRPSFVLPDTVKTLQDVRQFLAQQLEVNPKDLYPLGPSFFVHPKISAERVYPFLYNAGTSGRHWRRGYRPRSRLKDLLRHPVEKTAAYLELRAVYEMGEWYQGFRPDMALDVTRKVVTPTEVPPKQDVAARLNDNMRPDIS